MCLMPNETYSMARWFDLNWVSNARHMCLKCIAALIAGAHPNDQKPFEEFNQLFDVQTNDFTDFLVLL